MTIVILSSCKKDWNCEVSTSDGLNTSVNFRGTNQEKNDYEDAGTYSVGGINVVTECN